MYLALETTNFDELDAAQVDWDVRHKPLTSKQLKGSFEVARRAGIQLDLEHWNVPLELEGKSPSNSLSIAFPLQSGGRYISSGREIADGMVDVFGPDIEIDAHARTSSSLLAFSIETELFEQSADSPLTELLSRYLSGHSVIQVSPHAIAEMRTWIISRLRSLSTDRLLAGVDAQLRIEALDLLAMVASGQTESPGYGSSSYYQLANKARDFMMDRMNAPPSVNEICIALGISERALHYAFQRVYGVSPKKFLKSRRLYAVYQLLRSSGPHAKVTEIAINQGFWNLGYFARDYRSMFGELPSATLRRHTG